jgi:HEAT repeat protein
LIPFIEAATRDDLVVVRVTAYGALIRLGRKEMWDSLVKAAKAVNPEDRADALRVMVDLKDERAVPLLRESLTYTQPSVRGTAARGLGQLGRKEARQQIEPLLRDPVPAVRESAAAGLADLGGKASVPVLVKTLSDATINVRAATIAALLQIGEPFHTVASAALTLVRESDPAARASVAHALGKATAPNAKDAASLLVTLKEDSLPGPKIVAFRSLGRIGNFDALPFLKDGLRNADDAVRASAAGGVMHVLGRKNSGTS